MKYYLTIPDPGFNGSSWGISKINIKEGMKIFKEELEY